VQNEHRVHVASTDINTVAVVVSRTTVGNIHAGIAHRNNDDRLFVLHLAWDCDLKNEVLEVTTDGFEQPADAFAQPDPIRLAFPWPILVVPEADDEAELELVAGLCRRFFAAAENHEISYCLGHFPESVVYIDDQGVFRSPDPRYGLTCASLVIQVFNKAKLPLVKIDGWPARPEKDIPKQEFLIRFMEEQLERYEMTGRRTTITREKINFNKQQLGKPRVAPEEVAGACLEPRENLPVDCAACERLARDIVDLLGRLRFSRENMVPLSSVPSPPPD